MTSYFCRLLLTLFGIALLAAPNYAQAAPRVIFTIDVESTNTLMLPQQLDAVCKDGIECGLMAIARMLQERGLAGTFFLNVYEHQSWGDTVMRGIAMKLQHLGQDVALHTHPQWAYDPLRPEMYQYSLDEQSAIIRDGVRLLTTWTGKPVVAHRAGDYAADERTLVALERNGLRIDSSLFYSHPHCRLAGLGLPRNLPASWGGLREIPVTVYQREEKSRLLGDMVAPVTSVRKIDVDWFADETEARAAMDAAVEADFPYLVVFLHSFSFMEKKGDGKVPVTDRHALAVFRAILAYTTEKHLQTVTMRDLAGLESTATARQVQDILPRVTVHVGSLHYFWHRLRSAESGVVVVGTVVLLLSSTAVLVAVKGRRRKTDTGVGQGTGRQLPTRKGM